MHTFVLSSRLVRAVGLVPGCDGVVGNVRLCFLHKPDRGHATCSGYIHERHGPAAFRRLVLYVNYRTHFLA
jgi:hypothetical protein